MGHRYFTECLTGHALVAGFEPFDCWLWHDASVGYPTPLLETVIDPAPAGWQTILGSGNGSWQTEWKAVPAAVEKAFGLGIIRICQMKLANRTQTNPSAAVFARRLLEIENPAASENGNGHSLLGSLKACHGFVKTKVLSKPKPRKFAADRLQVGS